MVPISIDIATWELGSLIFCLGQSWDLFGKGVVGSITEETALIFEDLHKTAFLGVGLDTVVWSKRISECAKNPKTIYFACRIKWSMYSRILEPLLCHYHLSGYSLQFDKPYTLFMLDHFKYLN